MSKVSQINRSLGLVFAVLLLGSMAFSSCNSAAATPTTSATTSVPTSTPVSTPTPAVLRTTPPTVQELEEGFYMDPEIPRITCEQIKILIDDAQKNNRFYGTGGMVAWQDFFIIDVRSSKGEVTGAPGFNQPGHILGARSMPMTWYWVTDPREDPKVEELEAYQQELTALEQNIELLPKGMPIYVYDGTADDEAACIVAKMILEAGFPAEDVKVIWKGFSYWYYDLGYAIVQGDYNFEGE